MNTLLRSMALLSIAAAQSHAETSPRAPLGTPEPLPLDLPPSARLLREEARATPPRLSPLDPPPWLFPAPPPPPPPTRYVCPHCNDGADTPKRCRPCGVKMARRRGGR
jgi:hypothetical protein